MEQLRAPRATPRLGWALAAIFALIALGQCVSNEPSKWGQSALAANDTPEKHVSARSLNCRRDPNVNAPIIASFTRGDKVQTMARAGEWTHIAFPADCWVVSTYLTDAAPTGEVAAIAGAAAAAAGTQSSFGNEHASRRYQVPQSFIGHSNSARKPKSYSSSSAMSPVRKKKPKRAVRASQKYRSESSGYSCPCSGRSVCVGPRGGRYCITSGGNKRYGV